MEVELVGLAYLDGSGQWLSVPMGINEKWCFSGAHTGTSAMSTKDIRQRDLVRSTLSKFGGDTMLSG